MFPATGSTSSSPEAAPTARFRSPSSLPDNLLLKPATTGAGGVVPPDSTGVEGTDGVGGDVGAVGGIPATVTFFILVNLT